MIFDLLQNDNINKNILAKAVDSVRFIYPPDKSGENWYFDFIKNDNINKNILAKAGDRVRFICPPDKSGGNWYSIL